MGKSSKRGQGRQSAQHLLQADAMKKIESGNYEFKKRQRPTDDADDIMYGMDNLSAREEEDDWVGADMDQAPMGGRRNGGRGRAVNHEDDWDDE